MEERGVTHERDDFLISCNGKTTGHPRIRPHAEQAHQPFQAAVLSLGYSIRCPWDKSCLLALLSSPRNRWLDAGIRGIVTVVVVGL